MSAENWRMCPVCRNKAIQEWEDRVADAQSKYGVIESNEFLELWASVQDSKPKYGCEVDETLREDYEIGVEDDRFFVSYSSRCMTCGFEHKFKHDERVVDIPV